MSFSSLLQSVLCFGNHCTCVGSCIFCLLAATCLKSWNAFLPKTFTTRCDDLCKVCHAQIKTWGQPLAQRQDLFCKASENTLRTCCTLSKNACPCREQSCVYFFTFSDVMLYLCLVLQAAGLVGAQLELRAVCNGARCQQGYVHQKCGGQRAQQQQVRVHEACRVSVII